MTTAMASIIPVDGYYRVRVQWYEGTKARSKLTDALHWHKEAAVAEYESICEDRNVARGEITDWVRPKELEL